MRRSKYAAAIGFSATGEVDDHVRQRRQRGEKVFDFGVGQPDFPTPEEACQGGIRAIRDGATRYTSPKGTLELRRAIAAKLAADNRLEYSPAEEILVSSGAKSSLHCLLAAVVSPGEEVLLPTPTWVSYPAMVSLVGGTPRYVETLLEDRFRLTAERLRAAIGPRVVGLMLNSPCNPTGAVYRREELKEIGSVVREAGLWVITDEIYEKIIFDGRGHVSLAEADPELRDSIAVVNGVSKAYAMTGWRIGYAAGPAGWIGTAASIQSHQVGNPCSISQEAARAALEGDGKATDAMCREFARRAGRVVELLSGIDGLEIFRPEGTFYILPRIAPFLGPRKNGPSLRGDSDLAFWLLEETGVATVPGTAFAAPGHLRFSFATSDQVIEDGLGRVREALGRLGPAGGR